MKKRKIDYTVYSDEELIASYSRGEISGFDELYYRYSKRLFYFFFKATNNREKSEDLLQEVFYRIAKHHTVFNASNKFSTWIYTIANNLRKNSYRKSGIELDNETDPDELTDNRETTIENIDKILTLEKLNTELMKLPEEHRLCFLLRFREEFSVKETSEIMSCPEGTVKSRIYYTLNKISKSMREYNPKNFEAKYEKQ